MTETTAEYDVTATLAAVMRQAEVDLKAAHEKLCKAKGLASAQHNCPEWSSLANTLRWFASIREKFGINS